MEKEILFDPFPKQLELIDAAFDEQNRIIMYGGSIKGGKTMGCLGILIMLSKAYPYSRWAVVRKDLKTIKRNTIPSWNKIKPVNFIAKHNQDTQIITFTNGSQIIFMGENYSEDKDLDRWKGLDVNGFLLEEANELQEIALYKAIERAGSNVMPKGYKKPKPLILLTCNPAHNWVKTLFYDRWKRGTLPPGWKYISAQLFDNPFVANDKAYVDSLKDMPEYQYRRFVEGDWEVKMEGVLFAKEDFHYFSPKELRQTKKDEEGNDIQDCDSVLAYIDVADEGDDYLAMIVARIYGGKKNEKGERIKPLKVFIVDVIFTTDNVDITLPLCAASANNNHINYVRVESNGQGSIFVKELRKLMPAHKVLSVTSKNNKHTRILMEYDFIKKYIYFLDESEYVQDSPYDLFMRQLLVYMKDGSSDHDDAPDALSGLCKFIQSFLPHLVV